MLLHFPFDIDPSEIHFGVCSMSPNALNLSLRLSVPYNPFLVSTDSRNILTHSTEKYYNTQQESETFKLCYDFMPLMNMV